MGDAQRTESAARESEGHVAVIYFHGIGNQRRLDETSRLVDALDLHGYVNEPRAGRLARIRGRTERSRLPDRADVAYIALDHHRRVGAVHVSSEARMYEAYWAPAASGSMNARTIAVWAARQAVKPIRPLFTSWRSRQRLRRATLYRLHARWPLDKQHPYRHDVKPLLTAYNDFENPAQLRRYPEGTFDQFCAFLRSAPSTDKPSVLELASLWRRAFRRVVLARQIVLLTLLVTLILAGVALGAAVMLGLRYLTESEILQGVEGLASLVEPTFANTAMLVGALLAGLGVTRFAVRYMGDVVAWATYCETDEQHHTRNAILGSATDLIKHVLLDPDCRRVVIVAHSLGSTIAYDALLELGQAHYARSLDDREREVGDIEKLDQFITLASPVDLIHALFESHSGRYHRYVRVHEALRGDVGRLPFSDRRRPGMHWINLWDRADIISGPLFSPNQKRHSAVPIDNIEVSSLSFPNPARSHVAYFQHSEVIELLFDVIFDAALSFRSGYHPSKRRSTPVPERRLLGWQVAALVLPWIAATYVAARSLGATAWLTMPLGFGALALTGALVGGWLWGSTQGHAWELRVENTGVEHALEARP